MKTHIVKSWSHLFVPIADGRKTHDLRIDDRGTRSATSWSSRKYDVVTGTYTGREERRKITYITSDRFPCAFSSAVLPKPYVILSLQELPSEAIRVTKDGVIA